MIPDKLKKAVQHAAIAAYPNELCGFIVGDEFYEVENKHPFPKESFGVDPAVWREYEKEATYFIHSHPDWYPCPSEEDMQQQIASNLPWGIVGSNGTAASEIIFFGDQLERTPIDKRTFVHGVTDCYDLIRDWCLFNRSIRLPQFPRSWEWWEKAGSDLYKDNFSKAKFRKLPFEATMSTGPEVGDVFLASIGKHNKLNHGGIYIGNGLALHHLTSRLPVDPTRVVRTDPVNRWSNYLRLWLRYDG